MELLPPASLGHHQAGLCELVQMLHHAEARHPEPPFELAEGLPVLLEESVEQASPRRISQRLEDLVHGGPRYVTVWSHVKPRRLGRRDSSHPSNSASWAALLTALSP